MVSKVRVLRVITRLNVGGPAHHVLLLSQRLGEPFETLLVSGQEPPGEARATEWIAQYGVPVAYLPTLGREVQPWRDWHSVWALWRLIRKYKPHILHTHTAKAGAIGRLAAWLARVPLRIHTFHGHSFEGYFSPWRHWLYRHIERWLARLTHRIVVISERQRRDIVERFRIAPPEKVVVIPLGFPLERLDKYDLKAVEALRTAWGGKDSLLLGWIGRMVPIKRIDKLLRAVAEMKDPPRPFRLVLVGDGPEKSRWEALARDLRLVDQVVWAGLRWDIPEVLRALDAVVLVSDNEGTPVTLIEALACGIPVAATPVGGVPDLLAEGAYGFLLQDPLAESLRLFIENLPRAREKAQKAQTFIRTYYSEERLIKDIRALYSQLLSSPNFAP